MSPSPDNRREPPKMIRRARTTVIKTLLASRRLTQTKLAKRIHVSRKQLNVLINGARTVTERSEMPIRIAQELGCDVDELFSLEPAEADQATAA